MIHIDLLRNDKEMLRVAACHVCQGFDDQSVHALRYADTCQGFDEQRANICLDMQSLVGSYLVSTRSL